MAASLEEVTTYVFDMGDGTEPWKISSQAIDYCIEDGTEVQTLTISFWDWAFVDLVAPKKTNKRFTLSTSPAKDELARLRTSAVEAAIVAQAPPPAGHSLFGESSDSVVRKTPLKRKHAADEQPPYPAFAKVLVEMPACSPVRPLETKLILMKFTTRPTSRIVVKLDADVIAFLVLFIRSYQGQACGDSQYCDSESQAAATADSITPPKT